MMRKVFLFDLDSTLLQMNQDEFLKQYFKLVVSRIAKLKYDPNTFMENFQKSVYSMINNNGVLTNEEVFWNTLQKVYRDVNIIKNIFNDFYETDFKSLEYLINKTDIPNRIIKALKNKGYIIILATNPVFPKVCTYERMRWAGLDPNDFLDITTYENSSFSKPNRNYYYELLRRNNINPSECIMIGNDVDDDFSDLPKEIEGILITDYLINSHNKQVDIPCFTLCEFLDYINNNY